MGLDYAAMKVAADVLEIEITPCLLRKLAALEKATLKKMNKAPE